MSLLGRLFHARPPALGDVLRRKYTAFRRLLVTNNEVLGELAGLESAVMTGAGMTLEEVKQATSSIRGATARMVEDLNVIAEDRYRVLDRVLERIDGSVEDVLRTVHGTPVTPACLPLEGLRREVADAVGCKSANLGEVRNVVGLPVPAGFAITAFAYRSFVEGAGLQPRLTELWDAIDWDDGASVERASAAMQEAVTAAEIPQDVREAITLSAHDLYRKAPGRPRISLRSSAIGEDSHCSFAGLYSSFLNVPLEQVLRRWKQTVASKFGVRALLYMRSNGFGEDDIAMSVGCFLMIDARAAGVAYSVDPADQTLDTMLISGVWGLGKPVVDGSMTPDVFLVPRRVGTAPVVSRVAHKRTRVVAGPADDVVEEAVPAEIADRPCLSGEEIERLSDYLRVLEDHYRAPQDVEWAVDRAGRLFILQTRPLQLAADVARVALDESLLARHTVLLSGGATACPGAGSGPIVLLEPDSRPATFPRGAVLVARQLTPRLMPALMRAAAVVSEVGSATGHMASLAREYRVPAITGLSGAVDLPVGAEVTVDATNCRILGGRVEELLVAAAARARAPREPGRLAALERVAGRAARLNLTDPARGSFRAKNCQTYHDVVRFCHEMAISEMFNVNDASNLRERGIAYRLDTDVPLGIYMIDLGDGLAVPPGLRMVVPEQILSIPMQALWRGITTPGVRWSGARPIDVRGFLSVWANTMVDGARAERGLGDNSYAMVGGNYVNFGSRLGYHFTTLESVCSDAGEENYVLFRFKGGAADLQRRERRVRFIGDVLLRNGFEVDRRGDLLNGWVRSLPRADTEAKVELLGRLMGCARQLDVVMHVEATVAQCVEAFQQANYAFFDFAPSAQR